MTINTALPLLLLTGVVGVAVPTLVVRSTAQHAAPASAQPSSGTGTVTTSTSKTPGAKDKPKEDKGVFTITGSLTQLTPGGSQPLTVTIANPNGYDIDVTSIAAIVGAPNTGCPATALVVPTYTWTSGPAVTAPGKGSTTLTLTARYVDSLTSDTSACAGVTFPLTFTGTAEKAAAR